MKGRDELHEYWRNPGKENLPGKYLSSARSERSEYLVNLLLSIGVYNQDTILEIGCNSGRNLMHLWKAGYRHLMGIEINPEAVKLMHDKLPYLKADVRVGPVEQVLPQIETVDVIVTLAVLVHIHPESEFIFGEMADRAGRFIVTIEDERTDGARHFARNYQGVFENLGMRQIYFAPSIPGMHPAYCARAFEPNGINL
jgi:SAM-dependent methyltransferase